MGCGWSATDQKRMSTASASRDEDEEDDEMQNEEEEEEEEEEENIVTPTNRPSSSSSSPGNVLHVGAAATLTPTAPSSSAADRARGRRPPPSSSQQVVGSSPAKNPLTRPSLQSTTLTAPGETSSKTRGNRSNLSSAGGAPSSASSASQQQQQQQQQRRSVTTTDTTDGGSSSGEAAEPCEEPMPAATAFGGANGGHDSFVEVCAAPPPAVVASRPSTTPTTSTAESRSTNGGKTNPNAVPPLLSSSDAAAAAASSSANSANPLPHHPHGGSTPNGSHHNHHIHRGSYNSGHGIGGSVGHIGSGSRQQVEWQQAEAELSDITRSELESSSSDEDELFNIRPMQVGGQVHFPGRNLDKEREQTVIPSIEEEFFEYDDVKISKDEVKSKQWRVAGRKGTLNGSMMSFLHNPMREVAAGGAKKFAFADFLVAIDEVDTLEQQQTPLKDSNRAKSRLSVVSRDHVMHPKLSYVPVKRFEVSNLLGHASRVKCIAIAPGEREFVSCSNEDASVTLCSIHSDKEIGIFTGHQDTVINATFSHDGKYLATTSRDHTMILWDVVTAKQLLTFDHAKVVICCSFSRDSKYIATGCQDKICRLWETRKGRECLIFAQHEGIIISMSYAPDNSLIVSASADKTLRVWSTTTGKCKFVLTGHQGIVLSCHYTNDGKRIVSNDEQLVKIWSTVDGSCQRTVVVDELCGKLKHNLNTNKKLTWTLSCVAPGEFTQFFFVACNNRFVYLLNIETGEEVFSVFCKAPVYCLTSGFSQLGAFGDSFGNIYLIRLY